jgi:DNA helicase HerA-like ATPase
VTSFKFGKLSIDPVELGSRGNAVLGIRDSGKTYTATFLAERLFEAGIPFLAFDPIGVWRFLRVPGAGRGYPVVVAGGQEGDLPLTVASAPEIVRAAMQNGVSLVIDLFDINLTKADWKRIVMACVRVLLHENAQHGLRHVFIEEAAEFAPQRVGPDQGQVYAEIEKLARMGGNARLGYTLINQRAEEVNKAVLELCDNLFLHRQKGRNSLTALSKWLDIGAVKDHKDIIDTLSTLPTGECWAWLGGTERPVHVKVPAKHSLHPDRRVMRGGIENMPAKPVDVEKFVSNMRGTLVDGRGRGEGE